MKLNLLVTTHARSSKPTVRAKQSATPKTALSKKRQVTDRSESPPRRVQSRSVPLRMGDTVEALGPEASTENECGPARVDAELLKAYIDARLWSVENNLRSRLFCLQVVCPSRPPHRFQSSRSINRH
jgi:hypothetical protein